MINFNNSVTNVNETPGINANTIETRPAATDVPIGTVYISTNTNTITRSNGTNWVTLGGGASTPGIDSVLAVNQALTATRNINIDGNNFTIGEATGTYKEQLSILPGFCGIGFPYDTTTGISLQLQTGSTNRLETFSKTQTAYSGIGIKLSRATADKSIKLQLGDYNNVENGTKLIIDDTLKTIETKKKNGQISGLSINQTTNVFNFGSEQDFINIDSANNDLYTYNSGQKWGISIRGGEMSLGNFNNSSVNTGKQYIFFDFGTAQIIETRKSDSNWCLGYNIDFVNKRITLGDPGVNFTNVDVQVKSNTLTFTGADLESATSGGNSGQHLVITLNGTQYKIKLENP